MSTVKKSLLVLAITTAVLPITGCWDIKNLDRMAVVMAIGVDRDENRPELIDLTVEVALPREVAVGKEGAKVSPGGAPAVVYRESGRTVFEAVRKMSRMTPRRLFFAHNQVMIIGESLAEEGVDTLFDLIDRDSEVRTEFDVLVARKQKASDVLQIMTLVEKTPNQEIYNTIKTQQDALGISYPVNAKTFIDALVSDKKMPVAGSIEIVGDTSQGKKSSNNATMKPAALLKLGTMAVFRKGKLAGYLSEVESRGLSFEQDKINSSNITVPCGKDENASVEITQSKTDVKASVSKNGPNLFITIEQKANVAESRCTSFDISDPQSIRVLEKETENQIRTEIQSTLRKVQNGLEIDAFGFGEAVYQADPRYWEANQKRWNEILPEIPVDIIVKTKIKGTGITGKSYLQQQKEGGLS